MWVFSLGETPDAQKVGVSPGRDCSSVEDGCSRVILGRKRIGSNPDGSDRTCQRYQIRELFAPRIAGRVGIV